MGRSFRTGFTIIELLVVMAIIGILLALILPAIQSAREAARRSQCKAHLAQMGLALHNYHDSHRAFPPGWIGTRARQPAPDGGNGAGWGTMILPQIEQAGLFGQFDARLDIHEPANAAFREVFLPVFICPSDDPPETWASDSPAGQIRLATASYIGVSGSSMPSPGETAQARSDGVFYHNSKTTLERIKDGASNTLIVGERGTLDKQGIFSTWVGAVPGNSSGPGRILGAVSGGPASPPTGQSGFSSHHSAGAHFLFCDNHVILVNSSVNSATIQAAATISARDTVGEF